jgi:hypothetical protein
MSECTQNSSEKLSGVTEKMSEGLSEKIKSHTKFVKFSVKRSIKMKCHEN